MMQKNYFSPRFKSKLFGAFLIVFVLSATGVFGAFWRALPNFPFLPLPPMLANQFIYGYGYGDSGRGYGYGYGYGVDNDAGCYEQDYDGECSTQEALVCEPGTYNDGGSCQLCEAGTYQDNLGATSCTPCPTGTYQNNVGATSCIPQQANTSGGGGGGGSASPDYCPYGDSSASFYDNSCGTLSAVENIVARVTAKRAGRSPERIQSTLKVLHVLNAKIQTKSTVSDSLKALFQEVIDLLIAHYSI